MTPRRPDLVECWIFRVPSGIAGARGAVVGGVAGVARADIGDDAGLGGLHAGEGPERAAGVRPEPEFLLIRRAPGRIFPGLWQCVTGGVEVGERVPMAALREVREEVGFGPDQIDRFYDLDHVAHLYDERSDAIVAAAIFAVRVRPDAEPTLSHEHEAFRWVSREEAVPLVVWPSSGDMLERVVTTLLDPVAEPWFRLDREGHRLAR